MRSVSKLFWLPALLLAITTPAAWAETASPAEPDTASTCLLTQLRGRLVDLPHPTDAGNSPSSKYARMMTADGRAILLEMSGVQGTLPNPGDQVLVRGISTRRDESQETAIFQVVAITPLLAAGPLADQESDPPLPPAASRTAWPARLEPPVENRPLEST